MADPITSTFTISFAMTGRTKPNNNTTTTTTTPKPTSSDVLPDILNPGKYTVCSNYDNGFTKKGKVTTITELIANREARQTDRLTVSSFQKATKKQDRGLPFLSCMVLRITVPSSKPGDSLYNQFKKNKFDKKATQRATYKKCILLADLADDNQLTGVILEESNEDHNRLFQRDLSLEHVSVGSRCVVLSPKIEGNQLKNGAWVITTNRPLEFIAAPELPTRPLRSERVGHEIRYYVQKTAQVLLLEDDVVDPLRTKCNFHSCDRLASKALGVQTNCGCWMQNRRSDTGPRNTVLMFSFYFADTNKKVIKISDFSSLRTSKLFFENRNILAETDQLQTNSVYHHMQDQWRSTIEYVNDHGGWTIVGWYIRAVLDDEEKDESDETLYRTNVKVNVSYLFPTDANLQIPKEETICQCDVLKYVSSDDST